MNGVLSIPAAEYHAADGVSQSALKWISPPWTPAHFKARFITRTLKDEETPAKRLGTITHRVLLEPDTLADAFHVKPRGMKFTTKDGIAWKDAHADREIVTTDDAERIAAMRDAVWAHPVAKRLLAGGEMERSLFATDKDGVLRKGRLDCLSAGNIIPDLKTVEETSTEWVEKQIDACGWYRQGPFYCDLCEMLGIEKAAFVLICVEKNPPFDVCCYQLDPQVMELGRMCYQRDLALLNDCREKNHWPGRSGKIEIAGLPPWKMRQLEAIL